MARGISTLVCFADIMESMLQFVLTFLLFTAFGKSDFPSEDETISPMKRGVDDIPTSQLVCGLRPVSVLARSLDSFRSVDQKNSDNDGDNKILGGNYASHGEIPWQASIRVLTRVNGRLVYMPNCGGAIINAYWILSAAHCFRGEAASSFTVTAGDHHVDRDDEGEQELNVSKIIIHEHYTRPKFDYDIALVKIKPGKNGNGIQFNRFVQPICLPEFSYFPSNGTELIVSGWGRHTLSDSTTPQILKKTLLPIIDEAECNRLFKGYMTPRMICAGYVNGQTDLCGGDSGGPAAFQLTDYYILFGIVGFGTGCAWPNYPSVFTNVRSHLNWINSKILLHSDSISERTLPSKPSWND